MRRPQPFLSGLHRKRGLGLVELMISITLGLFIMGGVLQLFVSSLQSSNDSNGSARLQENIRFAIARIGDDIARAGSYGCFSYNSMDEEYVVNNLTLDAGANPDWRDFERDFSNNDDTALKGVNGAAGVGGANDAPDTLMMKYLDAGAVISVEKTEDEGRTLVFDGDERPSVSQNSLGLVGSCSQLLVFNFSPFEVGDETEDFTKLRISGAESYEPDPSTEQTYLYAGASGAYEYYIDDATNGDCAADISECALHRSKNGVPQELVSGVHDLQIRYGWEDPETFTVRYSDSADARPAGAAATATLDRVEVTMSFNAAGSAIDNSANGDLIQRTITRIFGLRNNDKR